MLPPFTCASDTLVSLCFDAINPAGLGLRGLDAAEPALESVPLVSSFKSRNASVAGRPFLGSEHTRFLKSKGHLCLRC